MIGFLVSYFYNVTDNDDTNIQNHQCDFDGFIISKFIELVKDKKKG
jgi:hypothetical protein